MERFLLRDWQETDAGAVAEAANNPKIADKLRNVFPHPYTLEDAKWFVNDCISKGSERQLTRAIVADGRAVGSIGVFLMEDVYEKSAEIGYWLSESYWGSGIMTEAVKQICREAFARYPIVRLFAQPFEHNIGSRKVLEKAGFACEGVMRNGVYKNGRVYSYCMYSLLKEELPAV